MSNELFHPEQFSAPTAAKHPKTLQGPGGHARIDPYYWLNERDNPEVQAYLEAENNYADAVLAPVAGLRETLYQEMRGRIQEDDNSVPYFKNGYWRYLRFEAGQEYPIYCRKKAALDAPEEIVLDVNVLAKDKPYCQLGDLSISPGNRFLAYAVDFSGRNLFQACFMDLEKNRPLPDTFEVGGTLVWSNDSRVVLYDTKDPVTLRNDKIWRHFLGDPQAADVLLYEEKDETAYASLSKTKSEQFFLISSGYTETQEVRFLDANRPEGNFEVFKSRETGLVYDLDHWGDRFLIRTNRNAHNFRLMATNIHQTAESHWQDVLPHRPEVLLETFTVFQDFLVTQERKDGLQQLQVIRWSDLSGHYIDIGEPTYAAGLDVNPEFHTRVLRYHYASLKTPATVVDYDMDTRNRTIRKVAPVLGGFDPSHYQTELHWFQARDGVRVPVSLVYRKETPLDASAPCYLIGYRAYGISYDPGFNRDILSLLDRGFIFGIAHIRGGMELGYAWYEAGKLKQKMNTFTDFIDCAEGLVAEKYTATDRLFVSGRSAGGLLMGAVANLRPDLFRGMITGVPFVDVVTTMSDPSIPLTTSEYAEWGNPAEPDDYAYMLQYSPYDQLRAQAYPNLLVLTSFADSQVQYFEPAKYVAKLRTLNTGKNMLLFHINMTGSHGGASGRFERLKERALEYAWMLGLLGRGN